MVSWTAWHDMADTPFLTGTEAEAKQAALPGSDAGDYVESPAGDQFGWNPTLGEWTAG